LLLLHPFDPSQPDPMQSAIGVEVSINGVRTRIPGRYFTLAAKRAIDARR